MVLENETIELVNYTKDIEFEYNIKFILMVLIISISIFLLWYSEKKIQKDTHLNQTIFYLIKTFSIMALAFSPLYTFLLLRSVEIHIVLNYILIIYTLFIIIIMLFVFWWSAQKLLEKLFKVSFKTKGSKTFRTEKDYRRD